MSTAPARATVYCPCRRTNVYVGRCNLCTQPGERPADADGETGPTSLTPASPKSETVSLGGSPSHSEAHGLTKTCIHCGGRGVWRVPVPARGAYTGPLGMFTSTAVESTEIDCFFCQGTGEFQ